MIANWSYSRVMSQPPTLVAYYLELVNYRQDTQHSIGNLRFFSFRVASDKIRESIYIHVIKNWNWSRQRFVCGAHWRKWDESLLYCAFSYEALNFNGFLYKKNNSWMDKCQNIL